MLTVTNGALRNGTATLLRLVRSTVARTVGGVARTTGVSAMGVPAYYGRPALVAGYARQSAPASVQVVVFLQILGGLLCLASAALVGAVAGDVVGWPDARWQDAALPGPEVRQAVAERGPAIAIAFALIGLVLLVLAGSLRRGRQWSRVL